LRLFFIKQASLSYKKASPDMQTFELPIANVCVFFDNPQVFNGQNLNLATSSASKNYYCQMIGMKNLGISCFQLILFGVSASGILSCRQPNTHTLFHRIPDEKSEVFFNNEIRENDSINPIDMEFLYHGGGVAIGDFNKDGLPDIYFTAGMVSNKLYLNKGHLAFEDITDKAGVGGEGKWSMGAAVIDINNDGWPDIYVCTSNHNPAKAGNLLYINQGPDKNGIPVFKEMAEEYGLGDTSYSIQAVFLDYDHDGDLDMYLLNTKLSTRSSYTFGNHKDSSTVDIDRLYQNHWSDSLKHPVFVDVSQQAGITEKGYGLGVTVCDINNDGWPDLYVTNDFISSDQLYMNNRNGTFSNRIMDCMKHTSQNAMGNDVVDINNDGLPDVISLDMNPEDNYRKQKNMSGTNYSRYKNMANFGYTIQYVRNTLQLNQGNTLRNDGTQEPVFSEIAYYAGIAQTDWSWSPSVADFDNDGLRDIIITNGYPKDVTDHDFVFYRKQNESKVAKDVILSQIPQIKIPKYAFRNKGEARFENKTADWGLDISAFSNGAAYVDLDNDGDLDYVINNINSEASIFENELNTSSKRGSNFLRLQFKGDAKNIDGIGAKAILYYNGQPHLYEHYPWRGYLSTVEPFAHFGLDSLKQADSLEVIWPNGKMQKRYHVQANQVLLVNILDAKDRFSYDESRITPRALFTNITRAADISFRHKEYDYIDFNIQRLLPHKLSQFGPGLAVGDVDGNGLDDIFIGGSKGYSGTFLLQQPQGKFIQKDLTSLDNPYKKPSEDRGVLLADLNNDGYPDLYIASGSNEFEQGDSSFSDRVYLNNGKGAFTEINNALPVNLQSKDCVKAADIDGDGDLDLFLAGRSIPHQYPKPASGYIYRNDSGNGQLKFTDVTAEMAPQLKDMGMISDALWTDFDNDGKIDLVVCGEFMPVTFLKNVNGHLIIQHTGIDDFYGCWNSIVATDVDNDGKMDYIVGNLGLNSFYTGTFKRPFQVFAGDFDSNGIYDAIPFLYLKDEKGGFNQFPAFTRDDISSQLIRVKKQFPTYKEFGKASLTDILTPKEREQALKVSANYFQTALLRNLGNGKFDISPLPFQAQWSPVFGMLADDFNNDGNPDILLNGNDYGTETNTGQYDAMNGLLMLGDGKGNFRAQTISESGIDIPGNGKALVKLVVNRHYAVAASQNQGPLLLFGTGDQHKLVPLKENEYRVNVFLKNGKRRMEEYFYGSSFLSSSGRFVSMNDSIDKIVIMDTRGNKRTVYNTSPKTAVE
jgi:hypothetical protein